MSPNLIAAEGANCPALPAQRTAAPALFSPFERAERRFREFNAHIRNPNTRLAYLTAAAIGEDHRGPSFAPARPGETTRC